MSVRKPSKRRRSKGKRCSYHRNVGFNAYYSEGICRLVEKRKTWRTCTSAGSLGGSCQGARKVASNEWNICQPEASSWHARHATSPFPCIGHAAPSLSYDTCPRVRPLLPPLPHFSFTSTAILASCGPIGRCPYVGLLHATACAAWILYGSVCRDMRQLPSSLCIVPALSH